MEKLGRVAEFVYSPYYMETYVATIYAYCGGEAMHNIFTKLVPRGGHERGVA